MSEAKFKDPQLANARDQGGTDKAKSDNNYLGEVILNLSKLKDWDGVELERSFELKKKVCDLLNLHLMFDMRSKRRQPEPLLAFDCKEHRVGAPVPTGSVLLRLKYASAETVKPIGMSLLVHEDWDSFVVSPPCRLSSIQIFPSI